MLGELKYMQDVGLRNFSFVKYIPGSLILYETIAFV